MLTGSFLNIFAQPEAKNNYQFLSPVPSATLVQPGTDIIIRQGRELDPSSVREAFWEIKGGKSGIHKGNTLLAADGKTFILKPDFDFLCGETVMVDIKKGIKTKDGNFITPLKYEFRIIDKKVPPENRYYQTDFLLSEKNKNMLDGNTGFNNKIKFYNLLTDSVPSDFPYLNLTVNNNPSKGQFFIAPFRFLANERFGYLMILENDGYPVYYRRSDNIQLDFKPQPNGNLTFFDSNGGKYYEMNSYYSVIDSFECGNGYQTDMHELNILPNGHALMIAMDYEYVRMDTIVAGGDSNAVVIGNIIQELDEDKNIIFQWRSWDHFQITDATADIDLTGSSIDYVHCNSIEVDNDGNMIISSRHMDEVTKINRLSGEIIWRLGGKYCKNNQFTFINDSAGFSHQHDARRLANGNLTVFDNGNFHNPQYTRVCEYRLDTTNRTATLVWQYKNDPLTYSAATGSARRLPDGNTLIGWGINDGPPSISEIHQDGSAEWAGSFPENVYNYRAFKYAWRSDYFAVSPDSLTFLNVNIGSTVTAGFVITNNSDSLLTINNVYCPDSSFSLVETLPLNIPSHTNFSVNVNFSPHTEGEYDAWLHLESNRYTEMIGQTVFLRGTTDSVLTYVENHNRKRSFSLYQNYPNPFNPATKIRWYSPVRSRQTLKVYDILGNEVMTLVNGIKPAGRHEYYFEGDQLSSGVYFYQLKAGSYVSTRKMLLVK